jgi:hypothetical protein
MVAREAWRTVAIATAGMTLALLLALPLTLASTRVLSVSALGGRMAGASWVVRQALRYRINGMNPQPASALLRCLTDDLLAPLQQRPGVPAVIKLRADANGQDYGLRLPAQTITPAHGPSHRQQCLEALALC